VPRSQTIKLYLHSPIRLRGVVLNYFSTGTMEFTQTHRRILCVIGYLPPEKAIPYQKQNGTCSSVTYCVTYFRQHLKIYCYDKPKVPSFSSLAHCHKMCLYISMERFIRQIRISSIDPFYHSVFSPKFYFKQRLYSVRNISFKNDSH
jgi:hypothetical protein